MLENYMNSSLLSTLNEGQRKSVLQTKGPLLIIAGAGSGKTKMITHRIAYLLEQGVKEEEILALTFTNKAGSEMGFRIRELTKRALPHLQTTTFHSFGLRILKKYIHHLGFHNNFTIYDQQDCISVFKEVLREQDIDIMSVDIKELLMAYSEIKTNRVKTHPVYTKEVAHLCSLYSEHMKLYNALDFDDLIIQTLTLFDSFPHILEEVRNSFHYIMVDEFQDTSLDQYRLIYLLAKEHHNIAVVGDDDQSIYSWRGANYENIVNFEKDFPERVEIFLDRNYRSSGTILSAANQLIKNNSTRKEKTLWTDSGKGDTIVILESEDGAFEAKNIITHMRKESFTHNLSYDNFGILVRTNHLIPEFENALMLENIPVSVSGGMSFFERKEVKDVIAYMRIFINESDDIALLRIINTPRRRIGLATLTLLRKIKDKYHLSYMECIRYVIEHRGDFPTKQGDALSSFHSLISDYKEMFMKGGRNRNKVLTSLMEAIEYRSYLLGEYPGNENGAMWRYQSISTFITLFSRWEHDSNNIENNIFEYLQRLMLQLRDNVDKKDDEKRVSLMTMHSAKGLEFNTVFLAGIEDHIIPHKRTITEDEKAIEEERRLFYVAITRAKRKLFISYASSVVSSIVNNVSNILPNISNDGGATITARGLCWSTSPNPTIED
ncbi:MAG: AAA family ATPase, partial [Spirochaetia bacterium]|nr:AAA family ATPase [Spirochaetia bacterium]